MPTFSESAKLYSQQKATQTITPEQYAQDVEAGRLAFPGYMGVWGQKDTGAGKLDLGEYAATYQTMSAEDYAQARKYGWELEKEQAAAAATAAEAARRNALRASMLGSKNVLAPGDEDETTTRAGRLG